MPKITINNFIGGIAESKYANNSQQFAMGQGLDIDTPYALTVNQALQKVGDTALHKAFNNGGLRMAYLTSYLYKLSSLNATGTWSVMHTITNSSLNGGNVIYNVEPVQSALIYATETRLGKSVAPFSSFNDSVNVLQQTALRPIIHKEGKAYIGNLDHLVSYDLTNFLDDIVPIEDGYYILDLMDTGSYIAILLKSNYAGKPSKVYWWDTFSEHYNYAIDLPFFVEALGKLEGRLIGVCNQDGTLYELSPDGYSILANKTLQYDGDGSGIYTNTTTFAGKKAVCPFKNKLLYGIASGTSNYRGGIWSIGRATPNLPIARNWEWRIGNPSSPTSTYALYSISNQNVVQNYPPNIYICVNGGGTTYKVMEIDYSNKVSDAFYESLILDGGEPDVTKIFQDVIIATIPLPANCSIDVYKKVNEESSWVTVGKHSGTGATYSTFPVPGTSRGENIQIKLVFNVSGNTAPTLKGFSVKYARQSRG